MRDTKNKSDDIATAAFERSTPVLRVEDYPTARLFYRDTLGFDVVEEGGDPPRFGIFERGHAVLFLDAWHGGPSKTDGWVAYIHIENIEALHTELADRAGDHVTDIRSTVYGMREFDVVDPDGNTICFGEDQDRIAVEE